jgi:hypothetical protein
MIPDFDPSGNLPPGIHGATWDEVIRKLGTGIHRKRLLRQVRPALLAFKEAGCRTVYLAGSFVTSKRRPGDIDILWDPAGVDTNVLDRIYPILSDGSLPTRQQQKKAFGAEFIASTTPRAGLPYLDFFQTDKQSDALKGILRLDLTRM